MTRLFALLTLTSVLLAPTAGRADAGFQLAIPDRNFPDDPVAKARVSFFWGNNDRTRNFDLGLVSVSQTKVRSGLALIGGVSRVTERSEGAVNVSFVNFHTGRDSGLNWAFVNIVNDTSEAFNLGFLQFAEGATAMDVGGVNVSKKSQFQIGFINITEEISGFQLGFINMAENGFFPFFPFFNYAKKN